MATSTARRPRRTGRKTAQSTAERVAKVAALRDRLEEWEGEADEAMVAMALATHDGYSDRNAMLIAMQMPEATDVDGFRKWQERGRQVRKGEHGIQILAPITPKNREQQGEAEVVAEWTAPDADPAAPGIEVESKPKMRFRITYVFDVSQTDPIEQPAAETPERLAEDPFAVLPGNGQDPEAI